MCLIQLLANGSYREEEKNYFLNEVIRSYDEI